MTTTRHRTAPRLLADPEGRGEIRFRGADLIEEVRRADLRGHGGGGFPTWRKMRAVADGRGRRVVVANGTEGEPASRKDETLLAHDPDLVIDGALAAAEAVGADEVVLAVARDNPAIGIAADAVARRPQRRGRRLSLAAAPPRFVTGEESALVGWLNGGPAVPTITPPRPSDRGVRRRPTLVQNVETLAHVALIARHGAGLVPRGRHPRGARDHARHHRRGGARARASTRSRSGRRSARSWRRPAAPPGRSAGS